MALGTEVQFLGARHIVLDGDPAPSPERGQSPQFSAHLYRGQTAGCIKMPLDMEVGLSPGDIALKGDPVFPSQKGRSPQFSAHVYCGQTAAWIKIPLGTKVGVGLRDIVIDGDQLPFRKRAHPPIFGHCPVWPNGWID